MFIARWRYKGIAEYKTQETLQAGLVLLIGNSYKQIRHLERISGALAVFISVLLLVYLYKLACLLGLEALPVRKKFYSLRFVRKDPD